MTRTPLTIDRLSPNRALADAIADWKLRIQKEGKQFAPKVEPKPITQGTIGVTVEAFSRADKTGTHDVVVALDAGKGVERTPVDIVCVIDISGSMQTEASTQNDQGVSESNGLSVLDVVKHAVATIIHALGPNDRCAIVSYSDRARIELELTSMTESGQDLANTKLQALHTEGSTNLWDGLLVGMDVLRAKSRDGRIPSVFLLTDGQPNVQPPRGHLQMLQRYKDEHQVNFTINSFGFGYNLDSHLLDELATEGGGAYAFIPEATFVGTVFVNAMSNLLVTAGADVSLSIEPVNGAKLVKVNGAHPVQEASWGAKALLGTVQFEQKRGIVVRLDLSEHKAGQPYCNATLQYVTRRGEVARVEAAGSSVASAAPDAVYHFARSLLCETVAEVMQTMSKGGGNVATAAALVDAAIKHIRAQENSSPALVELIKDLEGQMSEAVSRNDWWTKWGRHYLPSLGRAHQLQQCNNFKDPGVQIYGGPLFQKVRDIADAVFLKLPPPKPSRTKRDGSSYAAPASMNAYYDSACVCFSGESLVLMADASLRPCSSLRRGDVVFGGGVVKCVVRTACEEGLQSLVRLSPTLRITPWHPVQVANKWTFPLHLAPVKIEQLDATWNFVLEGNHSMVIGGVVCTTLGHGIINDVADVRSSVYWGRDILNDLAQMPGFEQGFVSIEHPKIERGHGGLVVRLIENSA